MIEQVLDDTNEETTGQTEARKKAQENDGQRGDSQRSVFNSVVVRGGLKSLQHLYCIKISNGFYQEFW